MTKHGPYWCEHCDALMTTNGRMPTMAQVADNRPLSQRRQRPPPPSGWEGVSEKNPVRAQSTSIAGDYGLCCVNCYSAFTSPEWTEGEASDE